MKGFISYPRTETDKFKEGTDLQALLQLLMPERLTLCFISSTCLLNWDSNLVSPGLASLLRLLRSPLMSMWTPPNSVATPFTKRLQW